MARAIDCGELEKRISSLARLARSDAQKSLLGRVLYIVENMPTLTPPNEPLTCRGCMYLPDCPSGIHCYGCARLYTDNYRRPPEGEA